MTLVDVVMVVVMVIVVMMVVVVVVLNKEIFCWWYILEVHYPSVGYVKIYSYDLLLSAPSI